MVLGTEKQGMVPGHGGTRQLKDTRAIGITRGFWDSCKEHRDCWDKQGSSLGQYGDN